MHSNQIPMEDSLVQVETMEGLVVLQEIKDMEVLEQILIKIIIQDMEVKIVINILIYLKKTIYYFFHKKFINLFLKYNPLLGKRKKVRGIQCK